MGKSVLAATNLGSNRLKYESTDQLHSFSFLRANTMNSYNNYLISGVVGPNGLILNQDAKPLFEVNTSTNNFTISFTKPYKSRPPTILAFPVWFRDSQASNPASIKDISYVISKFSAKGFVIEFKQGNMHIGFNFLVISQQLPTSAIRRAYIEDCTAEDFADGQRSPTKTGGLAVRDEGCTESDTKYKTINKDQKGVVVEFEPPFDDIPSVLVTPHVHGGYDEKEIPRCIVESISVNESRVKCGMVNTKGQVVMYRPIPFTVAAFGEIGKD